MTATRIKKNTTPTDAPPPMRRAMRHSRRNRASAGVTSRRRFRCDPKPQLLRAIQSERRVNGGDEDPAAFEMRLHDGGKRDLSGGVERGRRLVEQPERTLGDKQASKRHAPPLSGREQPRREIDHMAQTERRKRGELRFPRGIAAQHCGREGEVLAGGQRGLNSVSVAEIMRLFADRALAIAAVQRKAAGFNRQEAGERPEQARFSRPVRPGHDQAPRPRALRTRVRR